MKIRINLRVGLVLAIVILTFGNISCFSDSQPRGEFSIFDNVEITKPLVLTDHLPVFRDKNRTDILRKHAKVDLAELKGVESYAGYLYDDNYGSTNYFWYFPAKENPSTAPVVLYIEGTMRKDMFFSIFTQNGPFSIRSDRQIELRSESWHNKHHMIYMDAIPGMGFSHNGDGRDVPAALKNSLDNFFAIFPSIRPNPFFLAGSYYAWTYLPTLLAHLQHQLTRNTVDSRINFKGIIIANGLVNPEEQVFFGDYLYATGLIDEDGKREFDQLERGFASHLDEYDFQPAYDIYDRLILGTSSLFKRLTEYQHPYNILEDDVDPALLERYSTWVTRGDVRRALHIGDNQPYQTPSQVALSNWKKLINSEAYRRFDNQFQNYRVLIYTGNLDILCPYPSVQKWLEKISWSNKQAFLDAERRPWTDSNNELAGYIKRSDNMTEFVMINAGHHPCSDQAKRTLELVEGFTHDRL